MNFIKTLFYTFIFKLCYFNSVAQSIDSTEYHNLLDQIDIHFYDGDIQKGKEACDKLIDYCKKYFEENSLELWDGVSYKSLFYLNNSEFIQAEILMQDVLENVNKHHGKKNIVYAATLSLYSDLLYNLNNISEALELSKEVLRLDTAMKMQTSQDHSIALNNMALRYTSLGNPERSLEYLKKALPLSYPEDLPFRYENIADNEKNMGNFREAVNNYEKAIQLFKQEWGATNFQTLNCQVNYCNLRLMLGEYQTVINILTDVEEKALTETGLNKNHDLHARIQRYLFTAYLEAKDLLNAEIYIDKYINTCTGLYKDNPALIELARIQKAKLLERQGLLRQADQLVTRIFKDQQDNEDFTIRLQLYNQYISTKSKTSNYEEAIVAQEQLIQEIIKNFGRKSMYLTEGLSNLSKLHFENGDYEISQKLNIDLMANLSDHITSIFPYLSDNGKIQFKNKTKPIVNFINQSLVSHYYNDREYLKAINEFVINFSSISFSQSNLKLLQASNENQKLRSQWMEVRNEIEKAYITHSINKQSLDSLLSLSNELERELSLTNKLSQTLIKYEDFKNQIPQNESVLQFFTFTNPKGEKNFYALVNNHQKESPVFIPFSVQMESDSLQNVRYFAKHFWEKIEPSLTGTTNLTIVPDGKIYQAPFYSIRSGENRNYIFEIFNIRLLPDLKSMYLDLQNQGSKEFSQNISIFGNPDYSLNTDLSFSGTKSSFKLNELPATKKEIHSVRTTFSELGWQANLFEEKLANKTKLNKTSTNPVSILHIASHGSYTPPQSWIYSQEASSLEEFPAVNPMFYSGIHLSASKEANNNGYISAFEISNMQFIDLQLVTLSSCESGLGQSYEGEGVFGIRRAFFLAGAQNIISTIRKIPDAATFTFMKTLYENLSQSPSLFHAFRNTQKYMKDRYAPEIWSAFVLMGNGNFSISGSSRSKFPWWPLVLVTGLGILGCIYFLRSRNKSRAISERK